MTAALPGGGAAYFRSLHLGPVPLLMPNAWDVGSARLLEHLGFDAIGTTSSGSAASRGLPDGALSRGSALTGVESLVSAVALPVSADLENGFSDSPGGVAETFRQAAAIGLAGASVEDWSGQGLYDREQAAERVRAACEAVGDSLVVTARAENHIRGVGDIADTIARLQAYQEAGASVLFAPGLRTLEEVRTVVSHVDRPVSVLLTPGMPTVEELGRIGVRRVSVGGAFAFAAYGALVQAARRLQDDGTVSKDPGAAARSAVDAAFP